MTVLPEEAELYLRQRNQLASLLRQIVNWADDQDRDFGALLERADDKLAELVDSTP